MKMALISGLASMFVLAINAPTRAKAPCQVHVILFVPSDVEPPRGYQQRMDQIVDYTEAFFKREFKRWGHKDVVMPFRRKANGQVEVTMMRGHNKTSTYKSVGVRAEVMDALRKHKKITGDRQVWWIFVYAGDPPKKFQGFLGGFGPIIGGWSVCNFETSSGRISSSARLGSPYLKDIALKGMIHELGHGFQLPHIGPRKRDGSGNTLMGPTHYNFQRVTKINNEQRVYLSEAAAAMLSTHPAFRGAPDDRGRLPKVEANLTYTVDARKKAIIVKGQVRAPLRPVYALVADESDARPGEYWTKTYMSKVGGDGAFEVVISEPARSNGTFKTWFAFENGVQTGNGRQRGRSGGIAKPYAFSKNRWTFK